MPTYGSTWTRQGRRRRPRARVPGRAAFGRPRVYGYAQRPTQGMAPAPRPAAPRPPAPAAPSAQALPFDPTYESTVGNARRQYDTTAAGLQYQEGRVRQEYGFDDASDPFSRARMLERNFQQSTRGRLNSAGNNLYSSSFSRGEAQGRFSHEQNVAQTRTAYADQLQQIAQSRQQALVDREAVGSSAMAERIARAQEGREDPGPPAAGPGPAGRYTPRNSRGVGGGFWVATAGPNRGQRFRAQRINGQMFHVYASGRRVRVNNP